MKYILILILLLISLNTKAMTNDEIINKAVELSKANTFNAEYAAIVDFSRPANQHRFFLINVITKSIDYEWFTSHGKNSGDQYKATKFSNIPNSRQSSLGLIKTGDVYIGKHGISLRLIGLEKTNNKIERRTIVLHRADYVSKQWMRSHPYPGRSDGCITLDNDKADYIINHLMNGSIIYVNG